MTLRERLEAAVQYATAVLETRRDVASPFHAPIIQSYIDTLRSSFAEQEALTAERDRLRRELEEVRADLAEEAAENRRLFTDIQRAWAENARLREQLAAVQAISATWRRDGEERGYRFGDNNTGGTYDDCADALDAALSTLPAAAPVRPPD